MIEPYNLDTNSNMNLVLGTIMEKAFFFLIILITTWIFVSLVIWLIRKPHKIRKDNKIWCKKLCSKHINTISYLNNTNDYSLF